MALPAAGANFTGALLSAPRSYTPPPPSSSASTFSFRRERSKTPWVAHLPPAALDTFEEAPPRRQIVYGAVGLDVAALRTAHRLADLRRAMPAPAPWPTAEMEAQVPHEQRAPWFEDPAFQRRLDEVTNSRAEPNNWTRILVDGPTSFAQKFKNISNADVIMLKIYLWSNDKSGCEYAEELEKAAQRGAKIYIQYGVKSFYGPGRLALIRMGFRKSLPPVLANLATYPNVQLVPNDHPKSWINLLLRRDHEKYLITWRNGDPVRLIMGGMNISDAWMHGGDPAPCDRPRIQYRDTDVEIIGPTAKRAIFEFMADWAVYDPEHQMIGILDTYDFMCKNGQEQLYPPSQQNSVARFVRNRPRHDDDAQYIKNLYIELIKRVPPGEEVCIENAYLLPGADFKSALKAADKRGVKLNLVTNSPGSPEFEGALLGTSSRNFFRKFLKSTKNSGNTKFYEFIGNPKDGHNSMHQKIASFGTHGPYIIGSSNLDRQSLFYNKECVALIYDAQGRLQFDAMWKRDIQELRHVPGGLSGSSHQLTPTYLKKEPPLRKLKEKFYYRFKHWL